METSRVKSGDTLRISVSGEIDSSNSDQFIAALTELEDAKRVEVDLAQLAYISSAGLRGLLMAEKTMKAAGGKLVVLNVQPEVMEVFDITGFSNILTIE